MTLGRLWWLVQRDIHRGIRATWGDRIIGPKIWHWRNPHAKSVVQGVPIVAVLGLEHLTMAAWMLASWTVATGRNWRIILHDDGTLPNNTLGRFRQLGLSVELIPRLVADAELGELLLHRPRCYDYRARFPLGLKIFDVAALQPEPRFLLLDPDVLFFRPPLEILRWIDSPEDESCWFNQDAAEASNVTNADAQRLLGVSLWPRVNSGLGLIARAAIDLDFCEHTLSSTPILAGHFWRVEQTLFALCASRHGKGGVLPPTYEVNLTEHMAAKAIARHYVGAVRHRFWAEGVRRARSEIFPRETRRIPS